MLLSPTCKCAQTHAIKSKKPACPFGKNARSQRCYNATKKPLSRPFSSLVQPIRTAKLLSTISIIMEAALTFHQDAFPKVGQTFEEWKDSSCKGQILCEPARCGTRTRKKGTNEICREQVEHVEGKDAQQQ